MSISLELITSRLLRNLSPDIHMILLRAYHHFIVFIVYILTASVQL